MPVAWPPASSTCPGSREAIAGNRQQGRTAAGWFANLSAARAGNDVSVRCEEGWLHSHAIGRPAWQRSTCVRYRTDQERLLRTIWLQADASRTLIGDTDMLMTIAIILLVLWVLGLVSSYTLGGLIHILLVVAIVVFLIQFLQGRRG